MFAVGPNPWMHYKYADKYRPYNFEESQYDDDPSSSRVIDNHTEKTKSSAHPKKVKSEAKHVKPHKHTTWIKTKEVAEHVKDGIAKSVELTLGSVAFCVKPGGDDSNDVVEDKKITAIKENHVQENTELHGVFDADTKTWDDIKSRIDSTLKQSKEYPGVCLEENRPCHSGFAGCRHDKRKKSMNEDEKARVDRELKNIAHCILGSSDDEINLPEMDKSFENSTHLDENAVQQEKDPTISLTEKEINTVNKDLAAIWKVEEKLEITEEDLVGSGPDKVNFVIKGGFKAVHATMPDIFETRRKAIAENARNSTVRLLYEIEDVPLDALRIDEDVCSIAQQNRDLDEIAANLRYI